MAQSGEWEEWLIYFLSGVAEQSADALSRISRIDDLVVEWRDRLARVGSRLPERTIPLFVENPFWTVRKLAGRLGVAFTTAQRAIERLEKAEIVTQFGEARRNRVYCANAILKILDEPPRRTPRPARERPKRP